MKPIFVLFFLVFSNMIISQEKNCFDIARKGTLNEISSEYEKNNRLCRFQFFKYANSCLL